MNAFLKETSGSDRVDDQAQLKGGTRPPGTSPNMRSSTGALQGAAHEAAGVAVEAAFSASEVVQDATAQIAEVAKEAAHATFRAVSAQASELASNVTGELTATAEEEKDRGAAAMRGFAKAIRSAAGDLDGQSPQIARHFRGAAASVESLSDNLRSRSVSELFSTATDLARNQPAAFFAGAIVAGFALARFLKSTGRPAASTPEKTTESSPPVAGQSQSATRSAPSTLAF